MPRRLLLNLGLFALLGVCASTDWLLKADLSRPNMEFAPDMAHSPRVNAFAANPVLPDGKTLQNAPEGSIPRGLPPLHYTSSKEDATRAGVELASPLTQSTLTAKRGEFVFHNYCATCHGSGGLGNGPVAQRGFPPPPSLLADKARQMKDGQMFHVLTYGQNNMPSYASQISRDDRWSVIAYVRVLQQAVAALPATPSPASPEVKGGQ